MEVRAKYLLAIALVLLHDAASGAAPVLRRLGISDPLRMLAINAPAQEGAPPAPPGWRTVAPEAAAVLKNAPAGAPHHALAAGPGIPALRRVDTGGTQLNFEGQPAGDAGVSGAVGASQYVQLAGGRLAVYGKGDGSLQLGPVGSNALFADKACGAPHAGPAAIIYDQLAQRWIVSHQAWAPGHAASGPYFQCIAVSATPDAAGSYYRYALEMRGPARANLWFDSPAVALWPDAYYFTFQLFDSVDGRYRGPRICGIARGALLAGADAVLRCRDPGPAYGALAPAGLAGESEAPGHGSPALFLALDFRPGGQGDRLFLWRYSFTSDRLQGPFAIPVAPFRIACAGGVPCISQPAPGGTLAALGDRLMPQAVYRNDGGRESLLANHAIETGGAQAAVRWYELRDPFGTVQAFQQGTHEPDAGSRWMAAIGMDKAGNMALAYSAGAADTPPGIRYTGRRRTDPPGRMELEEVVVNGTGVQEGDARAWRGSGSLGIDPADGCTFWHTQQYVPSTGRATWRTRIASFRFRNCR